MHLPSATLRGELLSVPQFARLVMAYENEELVPTLIIKGTTLTLKYLIRRSSFRFAVFQLSSGMIAYVVLIDEFDEKPIAMWALVETEEELTALVRLCREQQCTMFLFNEACVTACSTTAKFKSHGALDGQIKRGLEFSSRIAMHDQAREIESAIDSLAEKDFQGALLLQTDGPLGWKAMRNSYITNQATVSELNVLSDDEGEQQEQLCTWLTDSLSPHGSFRSPQVHEFGGSRELTDILLTYPAGFIMVESKVLAVMNRPDLPPRKTLRKNILKNIEKAISQLAGGLKNIRGGAMVTDSRGEPIQLAFLTPPTCIVLVPELELLTDEDQLGGTRLEDFLKATGAYLHILDTSELFRAMQVAHGIESLGKSTPAMMAFDATLFERWETAKTLASPRFQIITRFVDETPSETQR